MSLLSFFQLGKEKRKKFDNRCTQLMQRAAPFARVSLVEEGHIRAIDARNEEHNIFTENAWRNWRGETDLDGREEQLQDWVNGILESLLGECREPVLTREIIVPQIKDDVYITQFAKPDFSTEHLAADLWIVYCADTEKSVWSIKRKDLEAMQVKPDELRPLAIENLLRLLPTIERHGDGSSYFMLTAGTVYCASLLLIDGIWEQQTSVVDGDVVAVVPCRDVLLFTGAKNKEALSAMRKTADELMESSSYLISSTFIRRSEGKWHSFS
jgi:Protein of unknown function (DUF1444)